MVSFPEGRKENIETSCRANVNLQVNQTCPDLSLFVTPAVLYTFTSYFPGTSLYSTKLFAVLILECGLEES